MKAAGTLASADGAGEASFSLKAKDCGDGLDGDFKYTDDNADVKIKGIITEADLCANVSGCEDYCAATDVLFVVDYGDGTESPLANLIGVCADPDAGTFSIGVFSGPYAGYQNAGVAEGTQSYDPCN